MNTKVQIQVYWCAVIFVLMCGQCWTRPPFTTWGVHESILDGKATVTRCSQDNSTDYICQQCARLSRSPKAYPMCCDPTDMSGAFSWCQRYITFGHE